MENLANIIKSLEAQNQSLRKREELLSQIVNKSAEAIITFDEDFIIDFANHAAENLFSSTKENLIHSSFLNHLTTDNQTILRDSVKRAIENRKEFDLLIDEFPTRWSLIAFESQTGLQYTAVIYALSGTESSLTNTKTNIQADIETTEDGFLMIDTQGLIQLFNPACESLFGYKEEEVIGQSINLLMSKEISSLHDDYLTRYITHGGGNVVGRGREVEAVRKDGSKVPVYLAVNKIEKDGDLFFTGVVRDLSAQKTQEKILIEELVRQSLSTKKG